MIKEFNDFIGIEPTIKVEVKEEDKEIWDKEQSRNRHYLDRIPVFSKIM